MAAWAALLWSLECAIVRARSAAAGVSIGAGMLSPWDVCRWRELLAFIPFWAYALAPQVRDEHRTPMRLFTAVTLGRGTSRPESPPR